MVLINGFPFSTKVFLYFFVAQLYSFIQYVKAVKIKYAQEKRKLIIISFLFDIVQYVILMSSLHRSEYAI